MSNSVPDAAPEVCVETRGAVPAGSSAYARTKILPLAGHSREPILYARVKLMPGEWLLGRLGAHY